MPQQRFDPRLLLAGQLSRVGSPQGQQQGGFGDIISVMLRDLMSQRQSDRYLDRQRQTAFAAAGIDPTLSLSEGAGLIAEKDRQKLEAAATSERQQRFLTADTPEKRYLADLYPEYQEPLQTVLEGERKVPRQEHRGLMRRGKGTLAEQLAYAERAAGRYPPGDPRLEKRRGIARTLASAEGKDVGWRTGGGPPVVLGGEQSDRDRLAAAFRASTDPTLTPDMRKAATARVNSTKQAINLTETVRASADAVAQAGPAAVKAVIDTSQAILTSEPAKLLIGSQTFNDQVRKIATSIDLVERELLEDVSIGTLMGNMLTLVAGALQSGVLTEGDIVRTSGEDQRSFMRKLEGYWEQALEGRKLFKDEINAMVLMTDQVLSAHENALRRFTMSQFGALAYHPKITEETVDTAGRALLQNILNLPSEDEDLSNLTAGEQAQLERLQRKQKGQGSK